MFIDQILEILKTDLNTCRITLIWKQLVQCFLMRSLKSKTLLTLHLVFEDLAEKGSVEVVQ